MNELFSIFKHGLMITSFVFFMMLLIEYINVQTHGLWQSALHKHRWGQYLLGALLGASPGCLGAFSMVSLYSHRVVSLGAVAAAMIATTGDEAFVMFSLFPKTALGLMAILFVMGLILGPVVDWLMKNRAISISLQHELPIHEDSRCRCLPTWRQVKENLIWELISPYRAVLIGTLTLFLFLLLTGTIGTPSWDWKRITFVIGNLFSLFVVMTVPNHFLEKHLWDHLVKKHFPRIFFWTMGTLFVLHFLEQYLHIRELISDNLYVTLIVAVLIGLIPESGPHLIFVTLFSTGVVPFPILLASSISQDGHGLIPLLSVSKKAFTVVQIFNAFLALLAGSLLLFVTTLLKGTL